ncbi:TPA: hypothetical protein N0F65_000992 [Lagenidium giganteum]|uniref:UDP-galactose transporter n=1 Tax=Lagenidium giganteum TaxID=4803 RepID=A0AAV2YWX9_9STRA|nr:TPA: hypothetical protein N0F65_000992 [Lagenidium giganteum]
MKVLRKVVGMLAVSALMCAGNLLINASKVDGEIVYISVTATFLIEVMKLLIIAVAIVVTKDPAPPVLSTRESVFYAVPSFLYMIDNNLAYVILRFIDPATLSVLWNLKILTTAALFRFVLKRPLSEIRKIAIVLLLLGVVTSQSDHVKKEKATNPNTPTPKPSVNSPNFMFGIILVLVAVTISSCASVFTEWTYKRKGSCSFLWQNAQLYIYGIMFNSVALVIEGDTIREHGFFYGYNGWTWAVILVNSFGGISMGFVLKYMDNIACVYSHAIAMMLTMLFSMMFFHFSPSLEFACGLSVLIISMYLYHHKVAGLGDDDEGHCHGSESDKEHSRAATHNSPLSLNGNASASTASGATTTVAATLGALAHKKQQYEKVPESELDIELVEAEETNHRIARSNV